MNAEINESNQWMAIRSSSIHNKGAYAKKFIPKGTKVIPYLGEKISTETADERLEKQRDSGLTYIFELDENFCIDGAVMGNDAKWINHSCDPNCEIEIIDDTVWIIASRDINPEEEVTFDYNFDDCQGNFNCACKCGSPNCRGRIVSDEQNQGSSKVLAISDTLRENQEILTCLTVESLEKQK